MRILAVILVFLVGALLAGLAMLPRLVTWDDYRAELTEQAEAITGQTVAIAGTIDLELLPRPTLTLARATLSSPSAALADRSLVVDRLDLRLKPLPLLRGRLEVDQVRLVRPVLRVEAPHATRADALLLAGGGMLLPLGAEGPSRLTVIDGQALVGGREQGALPAIEAINFEVGSAGANGPYTLDGDFAIGTQPFGVTGRLGQIHPDSWSTLQLVVTAPEAGSDPTIFSFRGVIWSDLAAPRLRGELSLAGSSAQAALDALGRALGSELGRELVGGPEVGLPAPPAWLAAPFRLAGHLDLVERDAEFSELRVALAGVEAAGSLRVGLGGRRPEIDLALDLPHVRVSDAWLQGAAGLAPLAALADLEGRIDISAQALDYRGGTIRELRTTLALAGGGGIRVVQARATLPGQTSVGFTGDPAGQDQAAPLQGALTVVADDLGALLAWFGLEPKVAPGRLRTLSLDSRLALDGATARFTDADLRVDASRLSGSLAVGLGARPQIAGAVTLDRLDLDAYLPDGRPAQLVEHGLRLFGGLDLALEARIERLTWHGLRLQDINLDGRSVAGQLSLDDLSLQDGADSHARLSGALDLERRTFELAGQLQTARPTQLLRGFGVAPPLMLARLAAVRLSGSASGSLEAFDLALELRHDDARLALGGRIEAPSQGPLTYALDVEGSDPDYRQLLDQMGIVVTSEAAAPAPFEITAKVTGDLTDAAAAVGTARLGAMSLTGEVDWRSGPPRPKLVVKLSAGEPNPDDLASLAALARLRPAPILTEGVKGGAWSSEPLAFGWLAAADAEVELSAKGGLAGPGIELRARLEDGRLMVDRLSASLWDGQLEAQVSLDGGRPLPFMAVALDLQAIDPTKLAAWLDLPPVIEGRADLYVEATTAGDNPWDLVRGLIGDAEVALHDGHLVGADLARLAPSDAVTTTVPGPAPVGTLGSAIAGDMTTEAQFEVRVPKLEGSFALERGIATAKTVRVDLGGLPAEIEGSLDLLLWVADLTFRVEREANPDGAPVGLKLVGPLDRPQLRLRAPPILPAQAP